MDFIIILAIALSMMARAITGIILGVGKTNKLWEINENIEVENEKGKIQNNEE